MSESKSVQEVGGTISSVESKSRMSLSDISSSALWSGTLFSDSLSENGAIQRSSTNNLNQSQITHISHNSLRRSYSLNLNLSDQNTIVRNDLSGEPSQEIANPSLPHAVQPISNGTSTSTAVVVPSSSQLSATTISNMNPKMIKAQQRQKKHITWTKRVSSTLRDVGVGLFAGSPYGLGFGAVFVGADAGAANSAAPATASNTHFLIGHNSRTNTIQHEKFSHKVASQTHTRTTGSQANRSQLKKNNQS